MKRIKKIFKITGGILLLLIVVSLLYYWYVCICIYQRSAKLYNIEKEYLSFNTSAVLVEQGQHLVQIKGCTDCHGGNLSGKIFLNDPALGTVSASNLTRGTGGLAKDYNTQNWLMALRHGINRQGKPLLIMPSHESAQLSKADLKAIIAYCKSVAPVNNTLPPNKLGPIGKLMGHWDKIILFSAEKINHQQPAPDTIAQITGIALGQYLSVSCQGCHKPGLTGGPAPAPGMLPSPNITASGNVGSWTLQQFRQTLHIGITPSGHVLKNKDMPWQMTAKYTDAELESVYRYLRSIK